MLTAYYDLAISPPTYEVVSFLLRVEQERKRQQEDGAKIVFLPGPCEGFRFDNAWPPKGDARHRVFNDLAVPLCALLPSCREIEVAEGPHMSAPPIFGAGTMEYGHHNFVRAFAEVGGCLRSPLEYQPPETPLVTITLREAEHWPERNSNVNEWLKAQERIAKMGYSVLLLRDNAHAPMHMHLRASMYRAAACNLFVCNGPAFLGFALDAPVLMFKPNNEFLGGVYSALHWEACGVPAGGQMPGTPPHQRIVWDTDDADVIVAEFERFVGRGT